MAKAKIIALMNNKGGVLKTTVATNIAGILSKKHKVLLIDTDQQGNVSTTFGANSEDYKYTLTEVLMDEVTIDKAIKTDITNLDVLPVNSYLMQFDANVYTGKLNVKNPSNRLLEILEPVINNYKYIIIDSAPSMNLLSINVINASDMILVPTALEIYSKKGVRAMANNLANFKKTISAIIPTLYDSRTLLHKEILSDLEKIAKENKTILTKTRISRSIKAARAVQQARQPIVLTNTKGKQVDQYHELVKELGL